MKCLVCKCIMCVIGQASDYDGQILFLRCPKCGYKKQLGGGIK